ncbi:MAG: HAD family hydrolase [Elusimicrobiaceae bacterium]|nr:HAD family hydrolase [Elusimicrobiaceae bacterium]
MKKLVLFDLDGTLINAGGAGKSALSKAVKDLYGKEPKFEASFIAGRTDTDNFGIVYELVKGKKATKTEINKIHKKYLELLPGEVKNSCKKKTYKLITGIKKFLERLSQEKDVILALGTGNMQEGAFIKLDPSGLSKYFAVGGFGEDGKTREEMLRAAVKRAEKKCKTKLSPDQVFVVGDTHRDISAAKACGFHHALIMPVSPKDRRLQLSPAELEVKDFTDIETFLVWLGLNTDPKGVKRGIYISPASAIEHVFFSRTGIDEDRLKMLKIKKYEDLPSGTIM